MVGTLLPNAPAGEARTELTSASKAIKTRTAVAQGWARRWDHPMATTISSFFCVNHRHQQVSPLLASGNQAVHASRVPARTVCDLDGMALPGRLAHGAGVHRGPFGSMIVGGDGSSTVSTGITNSGDSTEIQVDGKRWRGSPRWSAALTPCRSMA
jgi:hypothetical protein